MEREEFYRLIDERQNELFELLGALIRINSENFRSHGNEKEIAEFIHSLCLDLGMESDIYSPMDIEGFESHPDYFPGRNLENRFNVTARLRGDGDGDGLLLMAHLDTVEIGNEENWTFDPLVGDIRDGYVCGRGACDDKYAIASALFIVKLLNDCGIRLKKNLLFSAYCDEEHGGSHGALATVIRYPCDKIISMDGLFGEVWNCASGGQGIIYKYHTKDAVNSAELTASAIPTILEVINGFSRERHLELSVNEFYSSTSLPDDALRYMGFKAGNGGLDLGRGEISFTYYTDKPRQYIEAEYDKMEKILTERLAPMGIISDGFSYKTRFFHYACSAPDSPDILMMLDAAREATGEELRVCGSCLSDLSVISKYGSTAAFAYGAGSGFEA